MKKEDEDFLHDLCKECDKLSDIDAKKQYLKNLDSKSKHRLFKLIVTHYKDIYINAKCKSLVDTYKANEGDNNV